MLIGILLSTLLLNSGCHQTAEMDSAQSAATSGSCIDLTKLIQLSDPEFHRQAELYARTIRESRVVLRSYEFTESDGLEGWHPCSNWSQAGDRIRIRGPEACYHLELEPDFDCSLAQRIHLRFKRLKSVPGGRIRLQWIKEPAGSFTDAPSLGRAIYKQTRLHDYVIEVGNDPDWHGTIGKLRLEFLNIEKGVEIDSIVFEQGLSTDEETMLRMEGGLEGAALTLNDETRPAMRIRPGTPCSVEVTLPRAGRRGDADAPALKLRFATGISKQGWIHGGNAVRYRILAGDDDTEQPVVIFDRKFDPVRRWKERSWIDREVDLSAHAGRRIRLIFQVDDLGITGSAGSGRFAVWGHPIIQIPAEPPPNVLLILIDTLRADHLSCYGYERRTTPHLDALARRAVCFEEVVSSSCWTAPAVASLFTGEHSPRHGVRSGLTLSLAERAVTLAERFRRAGYFTGALSDNMLIIPGNGYAQGFHTFLRHPGNRLERGARELTDRSLAWLERNQDLPFFLYLHYMDPHGRYEPEPPYSQPKPAAPAFIRKFVSRGDCGEATTRIWRDASFRLTDMEQRHLVGLYDGEIALSDFHISRILAWLGKQGLAGNTMIVVLADHGEGFGEHGVYSHAHTLHDEEILVPLLFLPPQGPGTMGGARISGGVRLVDVAPTILECAGLEVSGEIGGRSLTAAMGKTPETMADRPAYSEKVIRFTPNTSPGVNSSIRHRGLKLIFDPRMEGFSLFDLVTDPLEQDDIYAPDSPDAKRLVRLLRRHRKDATAVSDPAPTDSQVPNERQQRQLEALGYIDG